MSPFSVVLWSYTALLIAGGLMGFIKAGSRASLVASLSCAIPLMVAGSGWLEPVTGRSLARWTVTLLLILFSQRWMRSRKLMPSGLMTLASIITSGLLAGWEKD